MAAQAAPSLSCKIIGILLRTDRPAPGALCVSCRQWASNIMQAQLLASFIFLFFFRKTWLHLFILATEKDVTTLIMPACHINVVLPDSVVQPGPRKPIAASSHNKASKITDTQVSISSLSKSCCLLPQSEMPLGGRPPCSSQPQGCRLPTN